MRLMLSFVAVTLVACEAADQVLVRPIVRDSGADARREPDPDVRPLPPPADAGPDAARDAASDLGDVRIPDAAPPDANFAPESWYDHAMVLSARPDSWVVMRAGEVVFAHQITITGEVGERIQLGRVPADGTLLATRTASTAPWVVRSEPDGELVAYNLATATPVGRPTGLHGPARLVGHNAVDAALLVGHRPEGGIGYVALEGGELGEMDQVKQDRVGAGLPTAVAAGLERWVLGYAGGICAMLDGQQDYVGHWRCGIRTGDLLLGTQDSLLMVGQRGGDVAMSVVAPGYEPPEVDAAAVGGGAVDAGVDFAFDAELEEDEGIDFALDDGGGVIAPDAGPLPGQEVLVPGARLLRRIHTLPGDRAALLVREAAGEVLWLVGPNAEAIQRIVVPPDEVDQLMGVAENAGRLALVLWNPGTFLPERVAVVAPEPLSPPAFTSELCDAPTLPSCQAAAEACGGQALCCGDGDPEETDIEGFVPSGVWRVSKRVLEGQTQEQVLALQGSELVLYAIPPGDESPVERARWAGVDRVVDFDASGDEAAVLADVQIDGASVRKVLRPGDPALVSEAGCAPALALRFRGAGISVYCNDVRWEPGISRQYPVEDVRWVVPRRVGEGSQLLAAVGDSHTLHLWSEGDEAITPVEGWVPPGALVALDAEGRSLPVHLPFEPGGWISRVRGAEFEVLVAGVGWVPVPGSAWPMASVVSRGRPIAASVGLRAPRNQGGEAAAALYVHDLRAGSSPLGRRVDTVASSANVRGVGLTGDETEAGEPEIYWGVGSNSTRVRRFPVTCR